MIFRTTRGQKKCPLTALRITLRGLTRQFAVLVLVATTLAGCATSQAARDRAIPERAQDRWNALLVGDFERAYSFLSPGYRSSRSVTDYEIDIRTRRVQYTSAEYRGHSCEAAVCIVQMMVGYRIAKPVQGVPEWSSNSIVTERWIELDGAWWFLPESG